MKLDNLKFDLRLSSVIAFVVCFLATLVMAKSAFAEPPKDAITIVLCNVVNNLQGTMGKAIATIGIIVLGIGLFLGKLSWPLAIATAIGIGLIFGAAQFMEWVTTGLGAGGGTLDCTTVAPK